MVKFLGRLVYRLFQVEMRYTGNWQKDNKWLLDYRIGSIIDIGANEGQFALSMRKYFPDAFIYSFEPIPAVYEKLRGNFNADPGFEAFNCGLGDKEDEATFFLNGYSPSSSLLKMKEHKQHFQKAREETAIKVKINTLDETLKDRQFTKPLLVKIDVQGFEDKVIDGGKEILKQADIVFCEVSFTALYEGQQLFDEIYQRLKELGFAYQGNLEQLRSPANNRILQADAIFVKSEQLAS